MQTLHVEHRRVSPPFGIDRSAGANPVGRAATGATGACLVFARRDIDRTARRPGLRRDTGGRPDQLRTKVIAFAGVSLRSGGRAPGREDAGRARDIAAGRQNCG